MTSRTREAEFTDFLGNHGSQLRHAFIDRYGPDVGSDVMGDVADYAWKRCDKVVLLHDGRLIASGKYEDVIPASG